MQHKWTRSIAGHYQLDGTDWTVSRNEDTYRTVRGYRWFAHHPNDGEFWRHTLVEAKNIAEAKTEQQETLR